MEEYCELKQKETDYEKMQIFEFIKMREAAEQTIKPKTNDIMRRPLKKNIGSFPSLSQSVCMFSLS